MMKIAQFLLPVFFVVLVAGMLFSGEDPHGTLSEDEKESLDYEVIRGGERVDFEAKAEENKQTIFYFFADWCGNCREFTPKAEEVIRDHYEDYAIKKVDVERWDNLVSEQMEDEYGMERIPFILVTNEDGEKLKTAHGTSLEKFERALGFK